MSTATAATHPAGLPLLQPMDLSRYSTLYTGSHPQLTPQISNDRCQLPSSSPPGQPSITHGLSPFPQHALYSSPQAQESLSVSSHEATFFTPSREPIPLPAPRRAPSSWSQDLAVRGFTTHTVGHNHYTLAPIQHELPEEYPRMSYEYAQPHPIDEYWPSELDDHAHVPEDIESENTHLKARKHVCPVCEKRFNRPSSLNTHMAVHTGAKPFQCHHMGCGRKFSVCSNLRRHEKTHDPRLEKKGPSSGVAFNGNTPAAYAARSSHHPSSSQSSSTSSSYRHYLRQATTDQCNGEVEPITYAYSQPPPLEYTPSTPVPSTSVSNGSGIGLDQYQITRPGRERSAPTPTTPRTPPMRLIGANGKNLMMG